MSKRVTGHKSQCYVCFEITHAEWLDISKIVFEFESLLRKIR